MHLVAWENPLVTVIWSVTSRYDPHGNATSSYLKRGYIGHTYWITAQWSVAQDFKGDKTGESFKLVFTSKKCRRHEREKDEKLHDKYMIIIHYAHT